MDLKDIPDELTRKLAEISASEKDSILIEWMTGSGLPRPSLSFDHDRTVAWDGESFEDAVNAMYKDVIE